LLFFFGCNKNTTKNEEPKCQLASLTRADYTYPITYEGTKVIKVGKEPGFGFRLTYGNTGKLSRVEDLSDNPTNRIDLFYNDEGKVSMEKNYEKRIDNWQETEIFFYSYTNGKLTAIRETVQWASPALEYDHEVIWEGDNIRSIITRAGGAVICTQQFSYDLTQKNPMTDFTDFYYGANFGGSFKRPLYTSANLLVKEENSCPSAQTSNLTYEFNDKNLLQGISVNGYKFITFSYECH
jgi:hypothetical protein